MTGEDPTAAIEGLRSAVDRSRTETTNSIDRLRTDLTGRMDQMVTRREHEAEVRRIDAEIRAHASGLSAHAAASEATNVDLDKRVQAGEKHTSYLKGALAVISGIFTIALGLLYAYIQAGGFK